MSADGEDEAPSNPPTEYITLNPNSEPLRLESLCTNCMKNVRGRAGVRSPCSAPPDRAPAPRAQGVTTMLMTKIPFFREARTARSSAAQGRG